MIAVHGAACSGSITVQSINPSTGTVTGAWNGYPCGSGVGDIYVDTGFPSCGVFGCHCDQASYSVSTLFRGIQGGITLFELEGSFTCEGSGPPPPAVPTLTTTASAGGPPGTLVSDSADLSGSDMDNPPTGFLTFRLYGPDSSCTDDSLIATQVIEVDGNGTYGTDEVALSTPGTYHWVVSYSGDEFNDRAIGGCGDGGEDVVITPAVGPPTPTLTTSASVDNDTGIITDTALLADGTDPTGSIHFALFDAEGNLMGSEDSDVAGNDSYGTGGHVVEIAGVYHWIATYSGDDNNNPVATAVDDADETVTYEPPPTEELIQIECGDEYILTQVGSTVMQIEVWRPDPDTDVATLIRRKAFNYVDQPLMSMDLDSNNYLYYGIRSGTIYRIGPNLEGNISWLNNVFDYCYNVHLDGKDRVYVVGRDNDKTYLKLKVFDSSGNSLNTYDLEWPITGTEENMDDYSGGAISNDGTTYLYSFASANLIKVFDVAGNTQDSDLPTDDADVQPSGIRIHPTGLVLVRTLGETGVMRVYQPDLSSFFDVGTPDTPTNSDLQTDYDNGLKIHVTKGGSTEVRLARLATGPAPLEYNAQGAGIGAFPIAVRCMGGGGPPKTTLELKAALDAINANNLLLAAESKIGGQPLAVW